MFADERRERNVNALLSLAVLAAIAGVAYADSVVITISLGFLYLLPLALSALVHRLRTSLVLAAVCVALHDFFGPFQDTGWIQAARNLMTFAAFAVVVVVLNRLGRQRRELTEVIRRQRDDLRREIELAAQVQQWLLPSPPQLDGYEIAGRMFPARTVSGDYFDYISLSEADLGLVVADVCGKGLAAALLMPSVEMALRMSAPSKQHTHEMVSDLNGILHGITDAERFVTLFYGRLFLPTGVLEYTNAGHLPPLLVHKSGTETAWLDQGGTVLGLIPDAQYESHSVQLDPGDLLVLCTDGVTEASNASGEQFGRQRLLELVRAHPSARASDLVERIYRGVLEFHGAGAPEDDMTIIALRRNQPAPGA